MTRVFISYRRNDSATITGRIYDRLEASLGSNKVFRDIDDISPGEDFRAKLAKEIETSDVLLVIIGPKWENITDSDGKKRLEDPNDFVRLEVEAGLSRSDTIVIPVLVEGATMPRADALPESLRELRYRNAVNVRQDPDFHHDIEKLIRDLQNIDKRDAKPVYKIPFVLIGFATTLLILMAVLFSNSLKMPELSSMKESPPVAQATVSSDSTSTVIETNTATATIESATSTIEATPEPILPVHISVIKIPDYEFTDIVSRLNSLGYNAEWINVYSDYATFSKYDVVYLPVGWAFQKAVFDEKALQYQRFVEEGGGLIVEQPNYKGTLKPIILPYELTFYPMQYDSNEWPPRVTMEHEIVKNILTSELPGPGNHLMVTDDHWTIITTSAKSDYPTLVVTEYGKGRIAVVATSISTNSQIRYQLGDNFIKNLIGWIYPY
jgi:hypothetical protein